MDKEEFVKLARVKYGESFDYQYLPDKIKRVRERIVCKKHGDIWVIPRDHLRTKYGCPHCASEEVALSNEEYNERYIERSKSKFGDTFDYSDVDTSLGPKEKVTIRCPVHGKIKMRIRTHYHSLGGCTKCGMELRTINRIKYKDLKTDIVPKLNEIHGGRYEYLKYDLGTKTLTFRCPVHGVINQLLFSHLSGRGCRQCGYKERTITVEEFLERVKKVHPEGYDYNLSELKTVNDKITIRHECGKEYKGRVSNHLSGQGCSRCRSSLGEAKVKLFLELRGIRFKDQYKIEGYPFKYDFYLPDLGILIEYDGQQHFRPIEYFGGEKTFRLQQRLDKKKNELAKDKGYDLIRIPFTEYHNLEEFLSRAIDRLFNYTAQRVFYRNKDALCHSLGLSKDTPDDDLRVYRTFEVFKKPAWPERTR